jgi:hypothetical protein
MIIEKNRAGRRGGKKALTISRIVFGDIVEMIIVNDI